MAALSHHKGLKFIWLCCGEVIYDHYSGVGIFIHLKPNDHLPCVRVLYTTSAVNYSIFFYFCDFSWRFSEHSNNTPRSVRDDLKFENVFNEKNALWSRSVGNGIHYHTVFHWCFSTTLRIKCISVIENLSKAKTFRNNDFTHTFKMIRHAPNTQIPKMKYKLRNS